jgi:hypothetical protein
MPHKLSRRRFLETTLASSAALNVAASAVRSPTPERPASVGLDSKKRESLRAAMDQIIPAGDGMPAASEVGGLDYLERLSAAEPQIRADLETALDALRQLSKSRFKADFPALPPSQQVTILSALEARSPGDFVKLRDHVYEAYYIQPSVWKLIGYDFHPTNQQGPAMKPFDESVLDKVRRMPRLYREVS